MILTVGAFENTRTDEDDSKQHLVNAPVIPKAPAVETKAVVPLASPAHDSKKGMFIVTKHEDHVRHWWLTATSFTELTINTTTPVPAHVIAYAPGDGEGAESPPASICQGDYVYVTGGFKTASGSGQQSSKLSIYQLSTRTWFTSVAASAKPVPPMMQQGHAYHSMVALTSPNRLAVMGGSYTFKMEMLLIEPFNASGNEWVNAPSLPSERGGQNPCIAGFNNRL
jgi:hypothetical protein